MPTALRLTTNSPELRHNQMPARGIFVKLLKLCGRILFVLFLFGANVILLWNFSGIIHKVKIQNNSRDFIFLVIVMDSGKAELMLLPQELEQYLKTHPNYSFLIPVGQHQLVQDQIVASYEAKTGQYSRKGFYPTFKIQSVDASHQYIEVYMHGDPHDDILWYKASEKEIEPQYYMVFSAFHLLLIGVLAFGMTAVEIGIGLRLIRERRVRSGSDAA